MVIRFHLHKLCIFLGILVCACSLLSNSNHSFVEVLQKVSNDTTVLIIDAGHGGTDGGAVGIDGTPESQINLEIAHKLNLLCKLCGVPTVMTRNSEDINYPSEANSISERKLADQKARLRLIQDYPCATLYSIHQNTYPSEKVSGIQVLYGHNESSQKLGCLLQKHLNEALSINARRVASEISNDIYLMKHCNCTAVLVECGFISNPEECKLLQQQFYQKKLTVVMLGAYLEYSNQ